MDAHDTPAQVPKPPPLGYVEVKDPQGNDPAWQHCKLYQMGSRFLLWCNYCGKTCTGTGINKMKQHIGGEKGYMAQCKETPSEVRNVILASLKANTKKPKEVANETMKKRERQVKRDAPGSRNANNALVSAVGRFFVDVEMPSKALNSAYFKPMINEICYNGSAIVINEINDGIIQQMVMDLKEEIEDRIHSSGKKGISILVEENWKDDKIYLNFLLSFVDGAKLYRTIDGTAGFESTEVQTNIFREIIISIGEEKILQIVCEDMDNYEGVEMRLSGEFPSLYWTSCANRIANRINDDCKKVGWINNTIGKAESLLRVILEKDTGINIDDGLNLSGFLAVKQVKKLEASFKSLMSTMKWVDEFSTTEEGINAEVFIKDDNFWKCCDSITKINELFDKFRIVVMGRKQPSMGYALAWMYKTKQEIKKLHNNQELGGHYSDLWKIIDHRWKRLQKHGLLILGFMFNPAYFHEAEKHIQAQMKPSFIDYLYKVKLGETLEKEVIQEFLLYFEADGDFNNPDAVRQRKVLSHVDWLKTFGWQCPNLVKIATNILSHGCSVIKHEASIIQGQDESDLEFIKMDMSFQERFDEIDVHGGDQTGWLNFEDEENFRGLGICFI